MEIKEELADLEHEQWMSWTKYLNANHKIPIELLRKWEKNWKPYSKLDEKTKDSDRVWADKVLKVIIKMIEEEINFYTGKNMTYKQKIERNLESGEAGHKSVVLIKLKQKLEGQKVTAKPSKENEKECKHKWKCSMGCESVCKRCGITYTDYVKSKKEHKK